MADPVESPVGHSLIRCVVPRNQDRHAYVHEHDLVNIFV
jgi:hypothetical protein